MHESAMTEGSRLSLIPAFYLSKFDAQGLKTLGYSSFTEAFDDIGQRLGSSPSSVKNKRDDFDPLHDNKRVGWQRPFGPSRAKTVALLDGLSFEALTSFVRDLLHNAEYRTSEEVAEVLASLKASETQRTSSTWTPRGATGRRAEELFMQLFAQGQLLLVGDLVDRRDDGCGYDFLIRANDGEHPFEVKGLAGEDGGILFTDKEWQTARSHPNYKIFLAYDLDSVPKWTIISTPNQVLEPRRQVRTVVQISWQVTASQLALK
jgi:hypothetical protein